ncbi:unnamed protein product [Rotaria sordida]|uniref:Uncharacterized protein n=1 Tax=Rotaria sordida TaxID=392033 RepID=A0A815RMS6_9BILA|nr:unnamed protein product [Rotaria sordida]CAF1647748.1 unnamed protein product [Rotaria sordida]
MGSGCCCCKKNQQISSEHHPIPQYIQIAIRTTNPMTFIDGYLKEPLVSLEEALEPFNGKIDQLSNYIKEAIMKCHYPSEHNLTRDESAAIYIYTMEWGDKCLRDHLQAALNSNDRSTLKPWFKYLKLFKSGLDKLPTAKTEIWQGAPFDEKLKEQLNTEPLSVYSSMCSCSPSANEITNYLQKTAGKNIILVGYQSVNGKLVNGYTANNVQEAIMWPGIKLGLSKHGMTDAYDSWILSAVRQIGEYYYDQNHNSVHIFYVLYFSMFIP